jgi:LmbE family N-acetylglucosaminyl deacetylase
MLPETSLVPYCVTGAPLGSFLVFAPHPDDEVFSIGGTLSHAAIRDQAINIVYMTNGELGGDSDTRIAEAHSVCEILNAKAHFLDISDSSVKATHALFAVIKKLVLDLKPDNVFLPSPQEFHTNHRGTASAVWRGLQEAKFSGDAFCYEISRQCECDTLIDITTVMENKQALCDLYASQLTSNNYTDVIKGINKARTYTLPAEIEYAEGLLKINNIYQSPKIYFKNIHENIFFNSLPYESPVISYLVRTKNRPELLRRCLASLAEQTYHANLDVVVVNDGGVNVDDVCVAFRIHFNRLKLVDISESIGRAAAANTALNHAQGVFINFLDDDDEIDVNHTQLFLNEWRRDNSIEILYRGVRVLKADGELMQTYNESFSRGRMMLNNYIPIHAVTFSRKFIDIGCRLDEGLKSMEDWDFWIQLSRFSDFRHIPTITATYHMVGTSAASPHMLSMYDSQSHINTVREKWMPKWTAVEMGLMTTFLQQQNEQRFQNEIAQIRESATRTLTNG